MLLRRIRSFGDPLMYVLLIDCILGLERVKSLSNKEKFVDIGVFARGK